MHMRWPFVGSLQSYAMPSFLLLHYAYILGSSVLGSVLIFTGGSPIAYIDALFMASSSCTQAGLNVVDLVTLSVWQQARFLAARMLMARQTIMYLLAMVTNPIFIHSTVVFVRIYWFKRRFKQIGKQQAHQPTISDWIVTENSLQLSLRRSRSRTKSRSRLTDGEHKGVEGRAIRVLFNSGIGGTLTRSPENTEILPDPITKTVGDQLCSLQSDQTVKDDDLCRTEIHVPQPLNTEVASSHNGNDEELSPKNTPPLEITFGYLPAPRRGLVVEAAPENLNHKVFDPFVARDLQDITLGSTFHSTSDLRRSRTADVPQSPPGHDIKRRTLTIEGPSQATHLRMRKANILEKPFLPTSTFDRAIANTIRRKRDGSPNSKRSVRTTMSLPYLSYNPTIGRNSTFVDLTSEQLDELKGIEYRALKTLAWILVAYFIVLHIFGLVSYTGFIVGSATYGPVVDKIAVSRGWWAVFTSASAFNDLGLTLTPDSFIPFQRALFPLFVGDFLIVAGNTGFPCLLRLTIWCLFKLFPYDSIHRESFAFLLDHPRRCFTLLFPSRSTWLLFGILALNACDLILFMILDLRDTDVTNIPVGYRISVGLFQAISTRTAGFSVVNLSMLHTAMLVSFVMMMYISVYPVAMTIRRWFRISLMNLADNDFERSLGIYGDDEDGNMSFVWTHVRRQLGFDLWFVFVSLFVISIVENSSLDNPRDYYFSVFAILFEVVSAYGTVGLSLGYPGINASFSAKFHTISKLVIIVSQIRGRHRGICSLLLLLINQVGLPYKIDRAVLLPSDRLDEKEEEDQARRRATLYSA
ncbi:Potassium transport protein 1 [Neolecta irregularis DAH-3]|uniref:Potassium transport protein n=1 Tax=Neolecta irregularis (strain DAH-3) TaxID=1198029 RepID=A0A1U7LP63_NEOID|nr:Potassium transport protein 1 [Neolecta irregularis DAH-3]|eukprot:OLL24418.1 Potassium transport protein 1 [Neolecta irregularis DAH-3]